MSLTRTVGAVGIVVLVALTAACGADASDETPAKKKASDPLTMSADPDDASTAPSASAAPKFGAKAVAEAAVQAIADQDGETYCALFEVNGKPPTPAAVTECADTAESAMTDALVVLAEAALESGPDDVEESGDRATVTYRDFDPETIDLVKIDGAWYATSG